MRDRCRRGARRRRRGRAGRCRLGTRCVAVRPGARGWLRRRFRTLLRGRPVRVGRWFGRQPGLGRWRRRCARSCRRRVRTCLAGPRIGPCPPGGELGDVVRRRHRPGGDRLGITAHRRHGRDETREDAAGHVVRFVANLSHRVRQPAPQWLRWLGGCRAPPAVCPHLDVRNGTPPARRAQRCGPDRRDHDGARATQRSTDSLGLGQRGGEASRCRCDAADACRSRPRRRRSGLPQPPHEVAAEVQLRDRVVRPARHDSPKVVLLKPWWAISSSSSSCVR